MATTDPTAVIDTDDASTTSTGTTSTGTTSTGTTSTGTTSTGTTETDSSESSEGSSSTGGPASCASTSPQWDVDIPQMLTAEDVEIHAGSGVAYVIGTHDNGAQTDVQLAAYAVADGALQWSLSLDPNVVGLADGDEQGVDLAIHASGDLLVVVRHVGVTDEAGLLRIDPITHTIAWWTTLGTAAIDPSADELDPGKVAVSDGGMVILSGTVVGDPWTTVTDQWVTRISPLDGSIQWLTPIPEGSVHTAQPLSLAVHDTEGIFALASTYFGVGTTTSRMARLTPDGLHLASYSHPYPGGWYAYVGEAVAFDANDDLAVAYLDHSPAPFGMVVTRQQTNFAVLSTNDPTLQDVHGLPRDLVVDPTNLAVVVGNHHDGVSQHAFLRVFDPAGELVGEVYESVLLDTDHRAIDLAPDGSFVVAGRHGAQGWLRRYDACTP